MTNQISFKAERKITQEDLAKKAKKRELFSNFGPLFGFVGIILLFSILTGGNLF